MKKENIPLYIGLALPIILIIIIAAVIYIPRFLVDPQYDFIYFEENWNSRFSTTECTEYEISEGRFKRIGEIEEHLQETCYSDGALFYIYDVSEKESREISIDEVESLEIAKGYTSPDGFIFLRKYSNMGIFEIFGGTHEVKWYLEKDGVRLPLNLEEKVSLYSEPQFIGWIIK